MAHPTEDLPNGLATVASHVISDREFAAQLELCYRPLRRMLRLRVCSGILSMDDLVQDTMAQAWERRGCFDPGRGMLLNWLWGIAMYKALSKLRQYQPVVVSLDDPEVEELLADCLPGPAEQYEPKRRSRILRKSLRRLPDRQRRAVVLHCLQGLTLPETAQKLSLSPSQVYRAVANGMKALSANLKKLSHF